MNKVKAALTKKLGPLPAWAWGLVAAGALYFYRQRAGGSATGDQQATPSYYGPYGQDPYPIQGGAGTGGSSSGDSGGGGDTGGAGTGTDAGAAGPTQPPPTIVVNPPQSSGGRPRTKKAKPQHTRHQKVSHKPDNRRELSGKRSKQPRGKSSTQVQRPGFKAPQRHAATGHHGSATRPRQVATHPAQHRKSRAR